MPNELPSTSTPKLIPAGYNDPHAPGNSPSHHTGKTCIEPGCLRPAGTAWSPHWCMACNVRRIERINAQLAALTGSPP